MMPPVSLPLNGGTQSARAGAQARTPHIASRLKAPIIRIAVSMSCAPTLKREARQEKNAAGPGQSYRQGVAALHLTLPGLRGTVCAEIIRWIANARRPRLPDQTCPYLSPWRRVRRAGFGAKRRG